MQTVQQGIAEALPGVGYPRPVEERNKGGRRGVPDLQRSMRARLVGGVMALLTWGAAVAAAQVGTTLGPNDGAGLPPTDLGRVTVGSPAPDFTLESKDSAIVALSSFRGRKNVVLVFYRGHW
jgi:hypothetical protein